ncbi:hypothetical protein J4526_07335 [Desulfurococcaceae archaeon MEX13E-LK6-19]|nr:hypothetical protein J4526_07335 [Desulfurococcaceae archaeon MEX13E-LK6-19]
MPWWPGWGWRGRGWGWWSPWPGRGPFSYLPPWLRPGWLFGRGACWWLFGWPGWYWRWYLWRIYAPLPYYPYTPYTWY